MISDTRKNEMFTVAWPCQIFWIPPTDCSTMQHGTNIRYHVLDIHSMTNWTLRLQELASWGVVRASWV